MEHTAFWVLLALVLRFTPTVSFCEEGGQIINLDEINNHFTDLLQGLDLVLDQFNDEKGALFKYVFLPGSIDARRTVKDGNSFASASKSCRLLAETRWRICPKGSTSARWISAIRTRLIKPCGVILKCYPGRGWTIFRFRREFVNGCSRNLSISSMKKKIRWFKFVKYPQPLCTCLCGLLRFSIFYFTFFSFVL